MTSSIVVINVSSKKYNTNHWKDDAPKKLA